MNTRVSHVLIEKLSTLSPQRLAEVEVFVDFLRARGEGARYGSPEWLEKAGAVLEKQRPRQMTEGWLAELRAMRQGLGPILASRSQPLREDEVQATREARRKWWGRWCANRR